jgi:hypothetical protein
MENEGNEKSAQRVQGRRPKQGLCKALLEYSVCYCVRAVAVRPRRAHDEGHGVGLAPGPARILRDDGVQKVARTRLEGREGAVT